jgi:hypothetical protein
MKRYFTTRPVMQNHFKHTPWIKLSYSVDFTARLLDCVEITFSRGHQTFIYRPLNTGLRFSINAVMPSAWSSVSMLSAIRSASICSWLSIDR